MLRLKINPPVPSLQQTVFSKHHFFLVYAGLINILLGLLLFLPSFVIFNPEEGMQKWSPVILYGYFLMIVYFKSLANVKNNSFYFWTWLSSIFYNIGCLVFYFNFLLEMFSGSEPIDFTHFDSREFIIFLGFLGTFASTWQLVHLKFSN